MGKTRKRFEKTRSKESILRKLAQNRKSEKYKLSTIEYESDSDDELEEDENE